MSVLEVKTIISHDGEFFYTFLFGIRRFGNKKRYHVIENTYRDIVQTQNDQQDKRHNNVEIPRVYTHDFTLCNHVDHFLNVYYWMTNIHGEFAIDQIIDQACSCLKRYAHMNEVNHGNFRQVLLTCLYLVLCYYDSESNMDPDLYCAKSYAAVAGFTNRVKFEKFVYKDVFKSLNYCIYNFNLV